MSGPALLSGSVAALVAELTNYEQGRSSGGALCASFRSAAQQWPGLPPRFLTVLETLLQPLESSALFSEESCAFSRQDLAASLRQWLQAAQLKAPQPGSTASGAAPLARVEQTG